MRKREDNKMSRNRRDPDYPKDPDSMYDIGEIYDHDDPDHHYDFDPPDDYYDEVWDDD